MNDLKLDEFTKSFLDCALWSSVDDTETPLDRNYSIDDFDSASLEKLIADCQKFQTENSVLIESECVKGKHSNFSRAGHDFWLTRNHHGAGFWDGDWSDDGDELTTNSHKFPEIDIYVGDDEKLYI